MLSPTYTQGELRLLEAADLVENSATYDQNIYVHSCGTPACVLGHYAMAHPEDWGWKWDRPIPFLRSAKCGFLRDEGYNAKEADYFGISLGEIDLLFNTDGCDNAGTDGKKAAAFIRDFVARKVRERLAAAEAVAEGAI